MSTNKTQNYNLHAWEPSDDFLRAEINENFAALDAGAIQLLFGAYIGTSKDSSITSTQRIDLPVTPRAVILLHGVGVSPTYGHAGIMAPGYPLSPTLMPIDETGFTVASEPSGLKYNDKNASYRYIVLY